MMARAAHDTPIYLVVSDYANGAWSMELRQRITEELIIERKSNDGLFFEGRCRRRYDSTRPFTGPNMIHQIQFLRYWAQGRLCLCLKSD